jgi:ribosome recycling factor
MSKETIVAGGAKAMSDCLQSFQGEMAKVRTGRASVALLDDVRVDYYGTPTPLSQIGTLSTPEGNLIVITPWEKTIIPGILKAIQKADLGLQPMDDGMVVRIVIPPLNEERRKEIVKMTKKTAEESRVSIRNARRDANEHLKQLQKDGEISEDDLRKSENSIQKHTDDFIKKIDDVLHNKEQEIMSV